ncbi:hypothetical protein CLOM_g8452 [Closterium sp. NIES-68]|nr:hypothetical protein CLOM_g8452 [Closterium sp. NIES-68]GJP67482.1 hypothetical protein CLOP_g24301 [Closterium sp. NIES-67]
MAWILKHEGGEERDFSSSGVGSTSSSNSSSDGSSGSSSSSNRSNDGSSSSSSRSSSSAPKGMHLSGVGAAEFALAAATVLSKPEHWKEAQMYLCDGNNLMKIEVEDAAIEESGRRLRSLGLTREMGGGVRAGEGRAAAAASAPASSSNRGVLADASAGMNPELVPVNTHPVVAALTHRVGCILTWARVYGSEIKMFWAGGGGGACGSRGVSTDTC